MKLLTQYSWINLLVMIMIFMLSCAVLYQLTHYILIREMDADLSGIEKKVSSYAARYQALPAGYPLDEEKISFEPTGSLQAARSLALVQLFSEREGKMHNFRQLVFPLQVSGEWYRVRVAKPVEGMHHLSRALIAVSVVTILVTILISLWLHRLLLRKLWKPFYASLGIMRSFQLGRTNDLHFPATNIAEFSFMNESLLMATRKAEQDYLLLKEFTENASHEIQTPLSVIRSKLDMLIQDKELSEKQSELAKAAYAAIKRLSRLNQSLLLLAKIENQQFNNSRRISLPEKITEKIQQFHELWLSRDITVTTRLQESYLCINPELLDILLNNLFSNASNHNIPSGLISIELSPNSLKVANTGSRHALDGQRLFSRFYKESVNSNHNGLGLSIIKQISKVSSMQASYQFIGNQHAFLISW